MSLYPLTVALFALTLFCALNALKAFFLCLYFLAGLNI